jgi:hypothetical protein
MNNVKYYKLNENGEVTSISESNIDSLSNTVDSSYIEINESERESLVKVLSSGDLVYKSKSGSWASVQYNKYVKIINNEVQYNTEKLREDKMGIPFVDKEDAPADFFEEKNDPNDPDGFSERAWDYVLGEMIWTFEQLTDETSEEGQYQARYRGGNRKQ